MSFKIKENVLWRKERSNILILSPKTKNLLIFNNEVSLLFDENGFYLRHEEKKDALNFFIKEGILEEC